jgi:hypothetical protein
VESPVTGYRCVLVRVRTKSAIRSLVLVRGSALLFDSSSILEPCLDRDPEIVRDYGNRKIGASIPAE